MPTCARDRWSPALAITSIAIVATLLTTLVMALAVKLVQRMRRGLRGGTGGGDGGSWRERLPFGRRSYAVCKCIATHPLTVKNPEVKYSGCKA